MAFTASERKTINEDLQRERENASFDPETLASVLYGGERLKRKRYIGTKLTVGVARGFSVQSTVNESRNMMLVEI